MTKTSQIAATITSLIGAVFFTITFATVAVTPAGILPYGSALVASAPMTVQAVA